MIDPFRAVVDDLTGGCGCACHTGIGYNTACAHCRPGLAAGEVVIEGRCPTCHRLDVARAAVPDEGLRERWAGSVLHEARIGCDSMHACPQHDTDAPRLLDALAALRATVPDAGLREALATYNREVMTLLGPGMAPVDIPVTEWAGPALTFIAAAQRALAALPAPAPRPDTLDVERQS